MAGSEPRNTRQGQHNRNSCCSSPTHIDRNACLQRLCGKGTIVDEQYCALFAIAAAADFVCVATPVFCQGCDATIPSLAHFGAQAPVDDHYFSPDRRRCATGSSITAAMSMEQIENASFSMVGSSSKQYNCILLCLSLGTVCFEEILMPIIWTDQKRAEAETAMSSTSTRYRAGHLPGFTERTVFLVLRRRLYWRGIRLPRVRPACHTKVLGSKPRAYCRNADVRCFNVRLAGS
jgi:hypothetical protein